jgi:hypothetical protein
MGPYAEKSLSDCCSLNLLNTPHKFGCQRHASNSAITLVDNVVRLVVAVGRGLSGSVFLCESQLGQLVTPSTPRRHIRLTRVFPVAVASRELVSFRLNLKFRTGASTYVAAGSLCFFSCSVCWSSEALGMAIIFSVEASAASTRCQMSIAETCSPSHYDNSLMSLLVVQAESRGRTVDVCLVNHTSIVGYNLISRESRALPAIYTTHDRESDRL